jgi:hypothetical protein
MVTVFELESGARPLINEREFAHLRGCSTATLQKDRLTGRGVPFLKDPVTGKISYSAETVLAFLNRGQLYLSTSEYDNRAKQDWLAKARTIKNSTGTTDGEVA